MSDHPAHIPSCPRCGYDQRGVVAAWDALGVCPLAGLCTECGLEFAWDEVAGNLRRFPPWSFEHAEGPAPLRLAGTLIRALWPWSLWRGLRMEQKTAPRRVIAFLIVCVLAAHLAIIAARLWEIFGSWRPSVLLATPIGDWWAYREVQQGVGAIAWPYVADEWPRVLTVDAMTLWLVLRAAAVPLGFVALGKTMKHARVRWAHLWRVCAYSMVGVLAITAGACLVSCVERISFTSGLWPVEFYSSRLQNAAQVAIGFPGRFGLTALWLTAFWLVAIRRYLRLPHAWGVVLAMVVLAFLFVSTLLLPVLWNTMGGWLL